MPKFQFHFDASDPRKDAAESAFFSRQLEHIRPQIFEVQYPQLKGRILVPKVTDAIHPGAETYTYRVYTRVGEAKISADYANDGPRADLYGSESTQKIRGIKASYGYSIQEARAAMMARLPLSAKKAKAARDTVETFIDTLIFDGKADMGLTGFLGLSSVTTYSTPNGSGGTATWETKTPDEIMLDMCGIAAQIVTDSSEVENPDTLLLPSTSYEIVGRVRMGDGSNDSILKHFLNLQKAMGRITNVFSSPKCETAGGGGTKRMVCYKRSPDKVAIVIGQEFEQLVPEQRGFEVITQCHARFGGVITPFPKSVAYGDGI